MELRASNRGKQIVKDVNQDPVDAHRPRCIDVQITSDFVCPWCFIGEARLRKALAHLTNITVEVSWKPFQLNPWVALNGVSRWNYRVYKFGSWERSQQLDAVVAAVGRADGLDFNFETVERTPNTFALHRVMQIAQREGDPGELAVLLMQGYFTSGMDLSDEQQVIALASKAGLSAQRVQNVLHSDEFSGEVIALEGAARQAGITAIPHFSIGGSTLSGAASVSVLVETIRAAAGSLHEAA
jgi:predicted DsbA family dithiol-disulfide isomerase